MQESKAADTSEATAPPAVQINSLIALYNQGQFQELLKQGQALVQQYPRAVIIHNLVGAANAGLGRPTDAIASYTRALQLKPDFAEAQNNIGMALRDLGKLNEAIASYARALQIKPDFAEAHNNMGMALRDLGRLDEAIASYKTALQLKPDYAKTHYNLGMTLRDLGKHDEAIASYRKALQIRPDYAKAHYNLGMTLREVGKLDEAIASYTKVVKLWPDFAEAHDGLGCALHALNMHEEAIMSFTRALQIKPDYADAHNNIGVALRSVGRFDEAIESYKTAVRLKPDHALAHRNLCSLFDKVNRAADFENAMHDARRAGLEDDPGILFLSAQLSSRKKNPKETLSFLERILPDDIPLGNQRAYFDLLGKTYEKLCLFDKAFVQFQRLNEIAQKLPLFKRCNPAADFDHAEQLTKLWSSGEKIDWSASSAEAEDVSIAFLVGFPRSGTTLLDTILLSHPGITVVEEKFMVSKMRRQFGRKASIEELNKLTSSDLKRLRQAYLDDLKKHVSSSDMRGLVIDKFPLNIRYAGLIHRVFPKAKFILALRHPCDCVLSCFAQNFELNDAMANFVTLDQSAKFYAAVMGLWRAYRNALSLDVGVVKYEDLIQDLRGTCMPLIAFLGLEWDDNLLNYQETAKDRGYINTPSYNQVTQPLYKQASGRWKNYREPMQEVLPILEPWIKEFGYGD